MGAVPQMCDGAFCPGGGSTTSRPNRLSPFHRPSDTALLPMFSGLQAHGGPRISRNKIRLSSGRPAGPNSLSVGLSVEIFGISSSLLNPTTELYSVTLCDTL